MDDIKPCPFCGNAKVKLRGKAVRFVVCCKCSATGPFAVKDEDAIEWWNRRNEK